MSARPLLVAFAGLPGSGKTTLARGLADTMSAKFLQIDTLEAALVTTFAPFISSPMGHVTAQWVADDQLRAGLPVVVDACHNLDAARQKWCDVSERMGADLRWVEVICSNPDEHRRRVEQRQPEWVGQGYPNWSQVQEYEWEPFRQPRILVDSIGSPAVHLATILTAIETPA